MNRLIKFLLRTVLLLFILLNIITAFHAYKFTHFYDASEAPVNKLEMKSGWAVTKDILFGINAYKQKNKVLSDSSFENVYLTTSDNIKLQGWYMKIPGTSKGTVILFHGHGSKKSSVLEEAASFRTMGYNTLLLDFRAHGNSGGNTSSIGYYESEDVKLAYDYIKEKGGEKCCAVGYFHGGCRSEQGDERLSFATFQNNFRNAICFHSAGCRRENKNDGIARTAIGNLYYFLGRNGTWLLGI